MPPQCSDSGHSYDRNGWKPNSLCEHYRNRDWPYYRQYDICLTGGGPLGWPCSCCPSVVTPVNRMIEMGENLTHYENTKEIEIGHIIDNMIYV